MAWDQRSRAISSFKRNLEIVCEKTGEHINRELQKAYEASLQIWWKDFVDWSRNKHSVSSFSFLREASSMYKNNDNFEPTFSEADGMYEAGINIDPDRMNISFKQQWGTNRGSFSKEGMFDLTYVNGIYGFNEDIVNDHWYEDPESIQRYIERTNSPETITKADIIEKIFKANEKKPFIPPKSTVGSPRDIMDKKARRLLSRSHVKTVMKKYLKNADIFRLT